MHRWKKEVQSAMFHATTKSTAANVVIGIREASGIKTTKIMLKVIQCVIPAIGVRPPFLTFAAVRAREFDTLKSKKVPQSLEIGLFFCQIFIFII